MRLEVAGALAESLQSAYAVCLKGRGEGEGEGEWGAGHALVGVLAAHQFARSVCVTVHTRTR